MFPINPNPRKTRPRASNKPIPKRTSAPKKRTRSEHDSTTVHTITGAKLEHLTIEQKVQSNIDAIFNARHAHIAAEMLAKEPDQEEITSNQQKLVEIIALHDWCTHQPEMYRDLGYSTDPPLVIYYAVNKIVDRFGGFQKEVCDTADFQMYCVELVNTIIKDWQGDFECSMLLREIQIANDRRSIDKVMVGLNILSRPWLVRTMLYNTLGKAAIDPVILDPFKFCPYIGRFQSFESQLKYDYFDENEFDESLKTQFKGGVLIQTVKAITVPATPLLYSNTTRRVLSQTVLNQVGSIHHEPFERLDEHSIKIHSRPIRHLVATAVPQNVVPHRAKMDEQVSSEVYDSDDDRYLPPWPRTRKERRLFQPQKPRPSKGKIPDVDEQEESFQQKTEIVTSLPSVGASYVVPSSKFAGNQPDWVLGHWSEFIGTDNVGPQWRMGRKMPYLSDDKTNYMDMLTSINADRVLHDGDWYSLGRLVGLCMASRPGMEHSIYANEFQLLLFYCLVFENAHVTPDSTGTTKQTPDWVNPIDWTHGHFRNLTADQCIIYNVILNRSKRAQFKVVSAVLYGFRMFKRSDQFAHGGLPGIFKVFETDPTKLMTEYLEAYPSQKQECNEIKRAFNFQEATNSDRLKSYYDRIISIVFVYAIDKKLIPERDGGELSDDILYGLCDKHFVRISQLVEIVMLNPVNLNFVSLVRANAGQLLPTVSTVYDPDYMRMRWKISDDIHRVAISRKLNDMLVFYYRAQSDTVKYRASLGPREPLFTASYRDVWDKLIKLLPKDAYYLLPEFKMRSFTSLKLFANSMILTKLSGTVMQDIADACMEYHIKSSDGGDQPLRSIETMFSTKDGARSKFVPLLRLLHDFVLLNPVSASGHPALDISLQETYPFHPVYLNSKFHGASTVLVPLFDDIPGFTSSRSQLDQIAEWKIQYGSKNPNGVIEILHDSVFKFLGGGIGGLLFDSVGMPVIVRTEHFPTHGLLANMGLMSDAVKWLYINRDNLVSCISNWATRSTFNDEDKQKETARTMNFTFMETYFAEKLDQFVAYYKAVTRSEWEEWCSDERLSKTDLFNPEHCVSASAKYIVETIGSLSPFDGYFDDPTIQLAVNKPKGLRSRVGSRRLDTEPYVWSIPRVIGFYQYALTNNVRKSQIAIKTRSARQIMREIQHGAYGTINNALDTMDNTKFVNLVKTTNIINLGYCLMDPLEFGGDAIQEGDLSLKVPVCPVPLNVASRTPVGNIIKGVFDTFNSRLQNDVKTGSVYRSILTEQLDPVVDEKEPIQDMGIDI